MLTLSKINIKIDKKIFQKVYQDIKIDYTSK